MLEARSLKRSAAIAPLVAPVVAWGLLMGLFAYQDLWKRTLAALFPNQTPLFERQTLLNLALEHLAITATAGLFVLLVGLPLAIWVARPSGAAFRPLVENLVAVGQTFPPVAVLSLALPFVGFGSNGAILALLLYGLLPVVRNTLEGLAAVPPDVLEAASGMGYSPLQRLWRVEIPLALPVILSGIRTSAVLILATATLAPLIGGGGLGVPIVAGLAVNNQAFVSEGAIAVALLAVLLDWTFARLEAVLTPWRAIRA
ncbi:ABC transporter permease [Calidithermus roseus]|uniref:Glycine betaine uptake system permease protein YehW n=1 Tax=Calidithermus roseus TaxID=1644118 RepID=A0A399EX59_9DEIN|nr:ABC transporter permease [Calidithermus roseus]RIH89134.1 Glycine betaine uptake system permease protein YehW [Calidithermus roseus]